MSQNATLPCAQPCVGRAVNKQSAELQIPVPGNRVFEKPEVSFRSPRSVKGVAGNSSP